MNPETKLILNEIHKSFTEHNLQWDQRFSEQENRYTDQIQDLEKAQDVRVSALAKIASALDEWRPSIEGTVDDMRLEVKKLSLGWERTSIDHPIDKSGVFATTPVAAPRPSAASSATPPVMGLSVVNQNQESGFGLFQP
jgi:hypothetical protein